MKTAFHFTYSAVETFADLLIPRDLSLTLLKEHVLKILFVLGLSFLLVSDSLNFSYERSGENFTQKTIQNYDFRGSRPAFSSKIDFKKLSRIETPVMEKLLVGQAPLFIRSNMKKYVSLALETAQKYKIDPFWVLAIMWTESHYKTSSVSVVGARGLMQVMPKTSGYIANKLKAINYGPFRPYEYKEYYRPEVNVEMGVYYLGYLLNKFNSASYATMAYNMGPGRLKRKLRRGQGRSLRKRNNYLFKVRKNYFKLLTPFQSLMKS